MDAGRGWVVLLQTLATVTLFCAAGWGLAAWLEAAGGPAGIRDRYGLLGPLVLVPLQGVISATPLPGELVALASSAVYGFWPGVVLGWCGWMLASFIQYAVARLLLREFAPERLRQRMPSWLRAFPVDHPGFLILGRWVPLGFYLVNSAAGVFRVPLWRHAWCAAVGTLPVAVVISTLAQLVVQPN